jgi:hypothetical protein
MKNGGSAWSWTWRRFIVDVLIGVSTVAVAFALIGVLTNLPYTLLLVGASALIGIGLLIEPGGTAQASNDIAAQPLRSGPQTLEHFDAPIVDATGG